VSGDINDLIFDLGALPAKTVALVRLHNQYSAMRAVGVMKKEEPVDTGTMRNSTRVVFDGDGFGFAVGPTVNYAAYVAYGTRRTRPNPFDLRTAEVVGPEYRDGLAAIVGKLL
jgi:hypothetical protein